MVRWVVQRAEDVDEITATEILFRQKENGKYVVKRRGDGFTTVGKNLVEFKSGAGKPSGDDKDQMEFYLNVVTGKETYNIKSDHLEPGQKFDHIRYVFISTQVADEWNKVLKKVFEKKLDLFTIFVGTEPYNPKKKN